MLYKAFLEDSFDELVEAIKVHRRAFLLNDSPCELRIYDNGDSTFTLKSVEEDSGNHVLNENYCVLYKCGGEGLSVWDCIGSASKYLSHEEKLEIISCISKENDIDESSVSEKDIQAFLEEYDPDTVLWMYSESLDNFDETHFDFANDVIDRVLEKIEDEIEESEED